MSIDTLTHLCYLSECEVKHGEDPDRRDEMKASPEDGRLHVRIPKDLQKRLKVECAKREVTMQTAVEQALREWLKAGDK